MARPSKQPEERRRLLPVVARAFSELGYRRTTTAELAHRCGVAENILFRLWRSKKAMFVASIDYVYDLSIDIWRRIAAEAGHKKIAERLLEYESVHHGEFGLYRIVFAGLSEADDPEIRKALARMYGNFQDFIRAQILEHRRAIGKTSGLAPEICAWSIVGLGTVSNIGRELGLLGGAERRRLFSLVAKALLEGTD